MLIKTKIKKNPSKRSAIVADAWAKSDVKGKHLKDGLEIEITDTRQVEVAGEHGVEIYARAWQDGEQIGFGPDGTVDIERFRFFGGLPFEVSDGTKDKEDNDNLKEDVQTTVVDNMFRGLGAKKQKFSDDRIVFGKIGNTTSLFYSATGANSPVDGYVRVTGATQLWDTFHDRATGTYADGGTGVESTMTLKSHASPGYWTDMYRTALEFDISAIGTDLISSGSLTVVSNYSSNDYSTEPELSLVESDLIDDDDVVTGDFLHTRWGTTRLASDISYSSWNGSGNNVWTLNSTGKTFLETAQSGDDIVRLGVRFKRDVDDTENWETSKKVQFNFHLADNGSSKPVLTIEHAATVTDTGFFNIL